MADPIITPAMPPTPAAPPETPGDTGSQALSEALRSSFVVVKIVIPHETSEAAKKLYSELAEIESQAPRSGLW